MDEGCLSIARSGEAIVQHNLNTLSFCLSLSASNCASGVTSYMKQRRFFEARSEESGEWLVLDGKHHPPRVICRCLGWNAPTHAALIAAALEAHSSELYSKFTLDGSGRLDEQPAVKASAEALPAPKPATGKSRARHRS